MIPHDSIKQATEKARSGWNVRTALISIPLAAVLLYFALRGADWNLVWSTISSGHRGYLTLGCLMATLTYFLRSLRWRVLLNAAGRLRVTAVFWATMAGYVGNALLPARAGEIVRSIMISSQSGLSMTYVLTTALTERLLDAVVLVLVGSAMLAHVGNLPAWVAKSAQRMAGIAAAGLTALIILPLVAGYVRKALLLISARTPVASKLDKIFEQLVSGIQSLHHAGRIFSFSGLTAAIWLLDSINTVIVGRALGLGLTLPVALLLLSGLGLGSALPSTPGYIGIYQFVAVTILTAFGFSRSDALAYILTAQFFNYLVVGSWGAVGILQYRRLHIDGEEKLAGGPH